MCQDSKPKCLKGSGILGIWEYKEIWVSGNLGRPMKSVRMPPRPKRKAKRRFSDGDRSAKKQRFDEEDEDENDGSFMAFVSTETSSEDLLTEEEHDEAPLPRVISLLPDLPKPWKGHFKASYLEHSAPPFVRLHNEILEFCSFITPTKEEIAVRNALLAEITSLVTSLWPESRVQVFGSQLTQLLTPTSDMDLAVLGVTIPEHEDMNHILTVLACQIKSRMKVSYVEAITSTPPPPPPPFDPPAHPYFRC